MISCSISNLVPLGFVSCSQEEVAPQDEQEINLNITAGGVQTRVNTLGTDDVWKMATNFTSVEYLGIMNGQNTPLQLL